MMTFADGKFILTLGARDQTLKNDNFDYNTGAKLSGFDESEVTPVGGIVFRPTDSLSIFGNYIEGLIAGDTAPFTGPAPETFSPVTNAGEIQDPIAAEQIELGVKFESDTFGGSLSVFNVEKPVGTLADNPATPAADLIYGIDGEVRHRGVEVGVYGQPVENVRVLGGVTWLDAEYTEGGVGLEEGNQPIGTPEVQANVNVEWDLPIEGVTLEARAMYTSSQFADTDNTLELDSWTRFDIGARYATELAGKPFSIRARIDNVTDENNWISAGGFPGQGYLVLGAPLTFVVSASIDF